MAKYAGALISAFFIVVLFQNCSDGFDSFNDGTESIDLESQVIEAAGGVANEYDFSRIRKVKASVAEKMGRNAFNVNASFDINRDGVRDRVICKSDHFIKILSGTEGKTETIYEWSGPAKERRVNGRKHTRVLSGCNITNIPGSDYPIILISNYWDTPVWRAPSPQYVVFHNGKRFIKRKLNIENFGEYRGVARNISCGRYPRRFERRGYTPGILCFIAEYTAATLSKSALLKLEFDNKAPQVVAKDLTPTTDLMWRNGVRGTSIYEFPVGRGWSSNQRDGAFMMGSTFMDFDRDGLKDFMTVGQHARVRFHKMVVDRSRPEGIRFVTTSLTNADRYNDPTEFIRISHFRHIERGNSQLRERCAYLSTEGGRGNNRDHILCNEDGSWVKHDLPISFASYYFGGRVRTQEDGDIIIRTRRFNQKNEPIDLAFVIPLKE